MRYTGLSISLLVVAAAITIAAGAFAAPIDPAQPNPPNLANNVPASVDLTWTPGDSELIVNGGFEMGNFTGWSRVNTFGGGGGGGGSLNNSYINTNGTFRPI